MSQLDNAPSTADPLAQWREVLDHAGRHDALGYMRRLCPSPTPAAVVVGTLQRERADMLAQLGALSLPEEQAAQLGRELAAFFDNVLVEACRWSVEERGEPMIWPWPPDAGEHAPPGEERLLAILHETTHQMLMELDLRQLLSMLVSRAARLTSARAALLAMGPLESGAFEVVETYGMPASTARRLAFGTALPERLHMAEGAFLAEIGELPELEAAFGERSGLLVAPLRHQGELVGLLACLQGAGTRSVEVLSLLANHTTIAIRNAALYREALQKAAALRVANEQLRSLDRMKDQFLATVSHELRTPINFITGFGSILLAEDGETLSAEQRHFVEKMLDGAYQLLSLVTDLLDYSSFRAGRLSLHREPVDVRALLEEAVASFAVVAADHRNRIVLAAPPAAPAWSLDAKRFGQVVGNLLTNAIKFSPTGATIAVHVGQADDALRIEVVDAGVGVPADKRRTIFERFSQIDASSTRGAGGVGLGLAIAKSLVEAHGGSIGVESPPPLDRAVVPGRGSMFWFTIPSG